jgi:hypothetical protein
MSRLIALFIGGAALWPAAAAAQATVVVTPAVRVEAAHDSNVLWRPAAREDDIWRLSPSLHFLRDTPRSHWLGDIALDAEWYARHTDLSTPFARQHAALQGNVHATERTRFELSAGYDSGIRPAELNLATGLTPGRVRGTRWFGGAEAAYAVTPRTDLVGRGRSTRELTETADAFIQDAEARVRHDWNDRNGGHVRYLAQYFTFDAGALTSHVMAAGWTRRLTPTLQLELDGGVRQGVGRLRPEIEAGAAYRGRFADVRMRYVWTHTTALGVLGLVEAQGAVLTVRYARPQIVSASLDAAVHRNTFGEERSDVYRFSAEIVKPVIGVLSIAAGWSLDHHRGLFVSAVDDGEGPLVPEPERDDRFTRHVLLLRVLVSGSVRSMAGPREPQVVRPGGEGEAQR